MKRGFGRMTKFALNPGSIPKREEWRSGWMCWLRKVSLFADGLRKRSNLLTAHLTTEQVHSSQFDGLARGHRARLGIDEQSRIQFATLLGDAVDGPTWSHTVCVRI